MYRALTKRLSSIFSGFSKQISQKEIDAALSEIRQALIDADVSLAAIESFSDYIRSKTQDIEKVKDLDPKSHLMNIIREALLNLLKHDNPLPSFNNNQLEIILMVGLQGAGKTTTCGKIATYINSQRKCKIMMASVDIYRPAAIDQLKIVANQAGAEFHPHHDGLSPLEICHNAIDHAKRSGQDILIIDTAGRLDIDQERMYELKQIYNTIKPQHTFYVVDSMMGQSALQTATTFNQTVSISGIILSKTDSDTKGGVALSIKTVINQPIFWVGTGEGLDKLETFNPNRIADQLLDMGDIIGLAEKAKKHLDAKKSEELSKKIHKGQFSLDDLLQQIRQIQQMGGMLSILKMMPGSAKIPDNILKMVEDDTQIRIIEALISSMTLQERNHPELVRNQKSRQTRILKGSGRKKQEMNELFKSYDRMKKMMDKLKGGKMKALMQNFMQSGQFPPTDQ